MTEPTVLIFGSRHHPSLALINQELAARSNRRVFFVQQELFFTESRLILADEPCNSLLYLTEKDVVSFSEIAAVCLDNFFVSPEFLEGFAPEDVEYIQTEAWATLIAFFGQLSEKALMANFITDRDHFASRWATLRLLAQSGLPVPDALVTSDPESLESFRDRPPEGVVFKPVSDPTEVFTLLDEEALAKLDSLTFAPVHFEQAQLGEPSALSVIGPTTIHSGGAEPPKEIVEGCRGVAAELGLALAEFHLRKLQDGRWQVAGLLPFVSPSALSQPEVLATVCQLLEEATL